MTGIKEFRERGYDELSEFYDFWYEGHWCSDEPAGSFLAIARAKWAETDAQPINPRILDAACGTGNPFVALTRAGHDVWGTDGSAAMIAKALTNCQSVGVSADRIIRNPISWTDLDGYLYHFEPNSFDLIVVGSNSFCHLPNTPMLMDVALRNFAVLLKQGGLIVIDTKRYAAEGDMDGVSIYKEQAFDKVTLTWSVRRSRTDKPQVVDDLGLVNFQTQVHHDIEYSPEGPLCRSLIILTMFGPNLGRRVICIPYYPLPAPILARQIDHAGFATSINWASDSRTQKWRYDIVVGQKHAG